MSIKRLFDACERRGDIGWRVAALVLPISNRPRVTASCAGKIGLRQPGEHTSGPNLASRDDVAQYTILETPPPVHPASVALRMADARKLLGAAIEAPLRPTVVSCQERCQWIAAPNPEQRRQQGWRGAVASEYTLDRGCQHAPRRARQGPAGL